jgi:hypothetical protein
MAGDRWSGRSTSALREGDEAHCPLRVVPFALVALQFVLQHPPTKDGGSIARALRHRARPSVPSGVGRRVERERPATDPVRIVC